MKKLVFTLFAVAISIALNAQTTLPLEYTEAAKTVSKELLQKNLTILASDEFEGRETGEAGQKKAAEYIINQLESYGYTDRFSNEFKQIVPLSKKSHAGVTLQIAESTFNLFEDFYYNRNYLDTTFSANEIVVAGYGIESENYSDLKDVSLKNKVVLIFAGEPQNKKGISAVTQTDKKSNFSRMSYLKKYALEEKGAALVLYVIDEFETKANETKAYLDESFLESPYAEQTLSIPFLYVSKNVANTILAQQKTNSEQYLAKINKKLKANTFTTTIACSFNSNRPVEQVLSENITAFLPATERTNKTIVISAHYDHIGIKNGEINNGADDDGSGTVSVLEIARVLKTQQQQGLHLNTNFLFLFFTGEEKGLLGSLHFANNPVVGFSDMLVALNIDMVGRTDFKHADSTSNYIYIIGGELHSKQLGDINHQVNNAFTKFKLEDTFNSINDPNRYFFRSDHLHFVKNNVPTNFYFSGVHEDYHQPGDDVEKIEFDKLQKTVQLVLLTALQINENQVAPKIDLTYDQLIEQSKK